jgi:hypothetical protein
MPRPAFSGETVMNAMARNCWMHFTCAMMLCALAYAGSVPATLERE